MRNLILIFLLAIVIGCKKDSKPTLAAVTTATVTNITANSAQISGKITGSGGSTITQSGICWATHSNPSIADSLISSGIAGTGAFSANMTNLNPNTNYFVRVYAVNGTGTAYGGVDSFTTAKGIPTVTTTPISNNQKLVAISGWTLVNNGGATISAVGICWSTSPHPTIGSSKTSDNVAVTSFSDTLANLNVTTYYVRAYATNSYGTAYGNEITLIVNATGTVTDFDGNSYLTVVVGTQTWMASNLKTTHYQNGDPIVNGLSGFAWGTEKRGAYSFPGGDTANNGTYGKLYSVYAINDSRNVCPTGWHVPTDGDWETIEVYEGMAVSDTGHYSARGTIGAKFLSGGSTGLNLVNAGILYPTNGKYYFFGTQGYYWSSSIAIPNYDFYRGFNTVSGDPGPIFKGYVQYAMSVRCIKN